MRRSRGTAERSGSRSRDGPAGSALRVLRTVTTNLHSMHSMHDTNATKTYVTDAAPAPHDLATTRPCRHLKQRSKAPLWHRTFDVRPRGRTTGGVDVEILRHTAHDMWPRNIQTEYALQPLQNWSGKVQHGQDSTHSTHSITAQHHTGTLCCCRRRRRHTAST